ncbi:MAG: protease SohB, partial [Haemophilus sp.]|nr:protease SohB [Haemophilus sp.]
MWSDILTGYGIFILEILTILLVIAAIVAMIISAKQRNAAHHGELVVTDLSEEFKETVKHLRDFQLSEEELKQAEKAEKKAKKQEAKALKAKLKNGEKAAPK